MKPRLLILFLFAFGKILDPLAAAQDIAVAGPVNRLLADLQASDGDPDSRLRAAWELGLLGTAAREALPALVKILVSPNEHPKARLSALNAVGRIGVSDKNLVDQIVQSVRNNSKVFGGAGSNAIVNASFELVSGQNNEGREKGAFGETMFTPGSLDLVGWTTYAGVTMIQDEGARPGGRNSLELGPRDVPGCISQTVSTTAGSTYELSFFACTGRPFQYNRQLRLNMAGADKTLDCVVGAVPGLIKIPFRARSALTTVTFCGVGNQGFGPMIDEVAIVAVDGTEPAESPDEASRVQRLGAIAQRLRGGSSLPNQGDQTSPSALGISPETSADGIALMSEEGRLFVGHQLDFFDTGEPGVLTTTKPAWINLYRTEGRDFTLSGEVSLGGASDRMLFPGDLPDGFALFLREWDGLQRYQLDSRNIKVKRRLLHGQPTSEIIPIVEFAPSRRKEWTPFRVRVSESMIEYSFAGNVARLPGPLDTDGANKVAIAPGTRLRNLRLSQQDPPTSSADAPVLP
ncbi:MAG: DUF642 domain-containing protein [Verrucomicrobiales bacterium]|nr:DUF642 domain-containing protein [Verrucomicrobiales bacterium]